MSPRSCQARRSGRLRPAALAAGLLGAALAGPAASIVGGQEGGTLARSAIMVLSSRGGVCSGVVVAPDVVLTAAHCVAGAPQHRVHYKSPDGEPVLLEPAAIAVHPGFDGSAIAARRRSIDLALVRVGDPLPAAFAPAVMSTEPPPKGSAVALGGYGVAREGDARSTGTFRTAALAAIEPYGPSRILIWASDPRRGGAGACTGDSGGPVAGPDDRVTAVATWAAGPKGAGCGGTSQGVLLAPQRDWIDRTLAGWGRAATWR